jgi:hypothetical protein
LHQRTSGGCHVEYCSANPDKPWNFGNLAARSLLQLCADCSQHFLPYSTLLQHIGQLFREEGHVKGCLAMCWHLIPAPAEPSVVPRLVWVDSNNALWFSPLLMLCVVVVLLLVNSWLPRASCLDWGGCINAGGKRKRKRKREACPVNSVCAMFYYG